MSTFKVNTITTLDGTGNITVSRPLSGDGSSLTNLPAANLTGVLPAISGALLTNLPGSANEITKQSSDPTVSSPATPTLGDTILNTTSGEMFTCTTVSAGANVWTSKAGNGSALTNLTAANLTGTLPALSAASVTSLTAANLTGALPAISGASLTGILVGPTISASDPAVDTNPSSGLGTQWANSTSGEFYVCTDATTDKNVWTNVGPGSGDIVPIVFHGGRGIFAGGNPSTNTIQYITISTTGNATDFGNMTTARDGNSGCTGGSRGIIAGGRSNVIDYITIATPGNAIDFGDLTVSKTYHGALSNGIRGVFAPDSGQNVIDYVTVATTGNATDFGDRTTSGDTYGANGETRGLFAGGGGNYSNIIDYITIVTPGNATDFGDLTVGRGYVGMGTCESLTRALFVGGGNASGNISNIIDYVTIATPGNATDFGDLTNEVYSSNSCGNGTRGVHGGGRYPAGSSNNLNVMDYITIATPGNAVDFGDLFQAVHIMASMSGD
jgi:hypothetical protein